MPPLVGEMAGRQDLGLILVALLVCAAGAWTCMALIGRARAAASKLRMVWISAAAIVFGCSVWAMHFVAMLAMDSSVTYDPALTALSIAIAMMIVFIGLTSAYVDRFLETRRDDESSRLKLHIAELEAIRHELDLALGAAQAANRGKSAFLANMSHELRTPLNAVIGFSELMVAETFGPLGNERYQSYAADIRKSGAHLLSLINDILDISRLEAGKAELNESVIDPDQLVGEARTMVENHAYKAGVVLKLDIAPDLPYLKADERRAKQILLNLLSNAVKFTPAGGTVTVSAALEEGGVTIAVEDTGIGIAKEDLPKAFESFGQIDNRLARRHQGSGLGLPLARHLAQLHGGSLVIESEVEQGTRATLRFPAARSVPAGRGGSLQSA